MRILSRYVLRQFLSPLGLSFLSFLAIFVVVDLADRLSAFLDRGVDVRTILLYYTWYIPYISVLVLPMAMLLASLFCIGELARHQELTAMKAAGISLYRIVLPVQALALLVSVGAFFLADRVMPEANRRRMAIERGENPISPRGIRSRVVLRDVHGQILSVSKYDPEEKRGWQVTLDQYKGRRLVRKVRGEEMVWEAGGWTLYRGEQRQFGAEGRETVSKFESMRAEGVTLRPEDLIRESRPVDQMRYGDLKAFIGRKARNGEETTRERVELHLRVAFPFANFVIVLFGVPLSSRPRGTGKPLQVGICLLVSFVYYGCIQAGRATGWNGLLPPFWAAWGANFLFLGVGGGMLLRAHK